VLYWFSVSSGWGAAGLVLLKYLLTFGLCLGCYLLAARRGTSQAVIALMAPIALNLGGWMAFTNVRAQLFTLFFFVVLYHLIEVDRRGKRWWIAVWLVMFVAWANLHGGVLSGLGMLGVYGAVRLFEEWQKTKSLGASLKNVAHLIAVGVISFLLLYVNPYGSEYVPYLIRAVTMDRPTITEWLPLYKVKLPLFYVVSVLIAGYGIWFRGKDNIFESAAIVLTAYLAWKHYRHGSLYAVTWACFVPTMIQGTDVGGAIMNIWKKYSPQVAVAAMAIGLVAVGYSIKAEFWNLQVPNQRKLAWKRTVIYPVGAVDYLAEENFSGNMFVPFNSGAYVSWKLYPQVKISIDSRYEVAFPKERLEEEELFYSASDGWETVLSKFDTHAVLVPTETAISEVLNQRLAMRDQSDSATSTQRVGTSSSFKWQRVYRDNSFEVYVADQLAEELPVVDRRQQHIMGVFP